MRTDPLEAKDRNGQCQGPRTQFFEIIVSKFATIFKRESAEELHFVKFLMSFRK